ncbi:HIT family hydrolase [Corynebacterium phocae]|uniref:HIT family hydrolase n=1 Tax=Corynebacterium phocae TaxID=161895 RepID=A0A1L7D6E7_9CORY|nr:HIT family protein [Corynebacterium phocae]APT93611.1 HIT family hydrolase [Corynebacterium phocae]KAA8726922.1 HIT family protein [Corynebacterium phocae]
MSSVFTKIINGELPARFVYRDDKAVAFLSIEPLRYGHTLVVPVAEVDKWTDLDPDTWAHLNQVALKVGQAVKNAFGSSRAGYIIAGFDVPHTHIHLFPADKMEEYDFGQAYAADATDDGAMDEAATRIRQHLDTGKDGFPGAK